MLEKLTHQLSQGFRRSCSAELAPRIYDDCPLKNIRLTTARNAWNHLNEEARFVVTRLGGEKGSFTIRDIASDLCNGNASCRYSILRPVEERADETLPTCLAGNDSPVRQLREINDWICRKSRLRAAAFGFAAFLIGRAHFKVTITRLRLPHCL